MYRIIQIIILLLLTLYSSCTKKAKKSPSRKISSIGLHQQVQELLRAKIPGIGFSFEGSAIGQGYTKSFELLSFNEENDPYHMYCSGGVKFGDFLSISANKTLSRSLRCENHIAYRGYFLSFGIGAGMGIGVGTGVSYGITDSFISRLKSAFMPNISGSEGIERHPDRIQVRELIEDINTLKTCFDYLSPNFNPQQAMISNYLMAIPKVFAYFTKFVKRDFSNISIEELLNPSDLPTISRTQCDQKGIDFQNIGKYLFDLFVSKAEDAVNEGNPAYLLPGRKDIIDFVNLWRGKGFVQLEKLFNILTDSLTGCDAITTSISYGKGPIPVGVGVTLSYYNEIGNGISREQAQKFISWLEPLDMRQRYQVARNRIDLLSGGLTIASDMVTGKTPVLSDNANIRNRISSTLTILQRCLLSDFAQLISSLVATREEAMIALDVAQEEIFRKLGLNVEFRAYQGEASNPAVLIDYIERWRDEIILMVNEYHRLETDRSFTNQRREQLQDIVKNRVHQKERAAVQLSVGINHLLGEAAGRYFRAKDVIDNSWLYVTDTEEENLRVAKAEMDWIDGIARRATRVMGEIGHQIGIMEGTVRIEP